MNKKYQKKKQTIKNAPKTKQILELINPLSVSEYLFIAEALDVFVTIFLLTLINNTVSKVKLATLVEGDPKTPFSIAMTQRCRDGCYSIPRISYTLPLILTL